MNKPDLIAAAAQNAGLSKRDTERALNAIVDVISAALVSGERVQLVGFGAFEVKRRSARVGRDPTTREFMEIPSTKVPMFKPCKALRDSVAGK